MKRVEEMNQSGSHAREILAFLREKTGTSYTERYVITEPLPN